MLNVGINGAAGQMGRRLIDLVISETGMALACALESADHEAIGVDAGSLVGGSEIGVSVSGNLSDDCDVLIDFSAPAASMIRLPECVTKDVAVVIGTTGFELEQEEQIDDDFSTSIPIVKAPNMSLGVNLLFALSEKVARALGDSYDPEIIEAHHRHKNDAPSGTARKLAECVAKGFSLDPVDDYVVHGREGNTGERPRKQIGMHAIRGGEIVGDHTVIFAGTGERVELSHKAESRDVFARGALQAARFVVSQPAGLYTMQDVLGL